MAGIKLGLGARVIYFGAVATADAVVATVSGVSRSAGNRRRLRQGHRVSTVSDQGPGNRWSTLPSVPQGRGFSAARLGRPAPAIAAAASGSRSAASCRRPA